MALLYKHSKAKLSPSYQNLSCNLGLGSTKLRNLLSTAARRRIFLT